ncbi:hypothetical protein HanRHA438_Chr17g0815231 [Helianthus annuus]|uniref:Uncharacterized protein n=1 Tax=Helianthus annuus TaxID=4232 RepID=A0A9K3DHX0_HELAN|nr:hypothetical protein HanXRQr2_Chr17g0805871 [Helianthus annuus]KAJ0433735.1 hypothetical protein HanIR_Chr17g0873591 [Helianthus annuus]KAJ0813375.1 hypothetical protein HanPSC8_Chr17g0772711 [Helianthus annuus]KAJ0826519.1 hypothetical protein HanRHA438_Chr17g0815231 [Helianthus annuus]
MTTATALKMLKYRDSVFSSAAVEDGGTSRRKTMAVRQTMNGTTVSMRRKSAGSLLKSAVQMSVKMAELKPR